MNQSTRQRSLGVLLLLAGLGGGGKEQAVREDTGETALQAFLINERDDGQGRDTRLVALSGS